MLKVHGNLSVCERNIFSSAKPFLLSWPVAVSGVFSYRATINAFGIQYPLSARSRYAYSHVLPKEASVQKGLRVRQWSCKIAMELETFLLPSDTVAPLAW